MDKSGSKAGHKMKLGVFGGTFDPVHCGHLHIAESAVKELQLDQVLFVPAFIAPHKQHEKPAASSSHRLAMLRLAIQNHEYFKVCGFEMEKKDVSYTIDTIKYLRPLYRDAEFYLILGADSWNQIMSWKDSTELLHLVCPAVAQRSGTELKHYAGVDFVKLKAQEIDVSSSEIRNQLSGSDRPAGLLPKNVAEYILEHSLYGV